MYDFIVSSEEIFWKEERIILGAFFKNSMIK